MELWDKTTLGAELQMGWSLVLELFTGPVTVNNLDAPGRGPLRLKNCYPMPPLDQAIKSWTHSPNGRFSICSIYCNIA